MLRRSNIIHDGGAELDNVAAELIWQRWRRIILIKIYENESLSRSWRKLVRAVYCVVIYGRIFCPET